MLDVGLFVFSCLLQCALSASSLSDVSRYSHAWLTRVALKVFEGLGEAIFKEFIIGWEPVSTVHYTMPGMSINHPQHSLAEGPGGWSLLTSG